MTDLSECYVCQKCGRSYSIQELRGSMFCRCGAYLSVNTCSKKVMQSSKESEAITTYGFQDPVKGNIPAEYRKKLIEAHESCSEILIRRGFKPEPIETALIVEELRWFWKPKKVKFIIVAESHVYTSKYEVAVKIDPHKLSTFVPDFPREAPLNFVKFVYCLGYGRPEILDQPEKISFNPGTKHTSTFLRDAWISKAHMRTVICVGKTNCLLRLKLADYGFLMLHVTLVLWEEKFACQTI